MARKKKLIEATQEEEIDNTDETLENETVENEDEVSDEETDKETGEEEEVDESAGSDTLHPGAGSGGGIEPTRMETISNALGYLAKADQSTLKYFNGMMSSHFGRDFGVGEVKEKNQNSIDAKPSDAVGGGKSKTSMPLQPGGTNCDMKLTPIGHGMNEVVKQEVAAIFEGQELSPEFKEKATVLFEASLNARIAEETAKLEEAYEAALEEEVKEIHEAVEKHVEVYCEHVASEWMKENEVAIESSLRNEITTEFMSKLRDLFNESNVNIPEDQIEVVDALAEKNEELEARLAEAIKENAELREVKEKAERSEAVSEAVKGLTLADSEKVKTLCENVEAENIEEFSKKLEIIKNSVQKPAKKSTVQNLMEEVSEDNAEEVEKTVSPNMKRYVEAIRRTVPVTERAAS